MMEKVERLLDVAEEKIAVAKRQGKFTVALSTRIWEDVQKQIDDLLDGKKVA